MSKSQKNISLGIVSVSSPDYVFLSSNGTVICQKEITRKPDEPNRIVTSCIDIMEESSLSMANIDQFIVLSGPGSLTGIRVGLSPIRAWSYVTGKPIVSLSSLEVLAHGYHGSILALISARRDHYWVQEFTDSKAEPEPPSIVEVSFLEQYNTPDWKWISPQLLEPSKAKFVHDYLTPEKITGLACTKKPQPWMKVLPTYLFEMDNGIG